MSDPSGFCLKLVNTGISSATTCCFLATDRVEEARAAPPKSDFGGDRVLLAMDFVAVDDEGVVVVGFFFLLPPPREMVPKERAGDGTGFFGVTTGDAFFLDGDGLNSDTVPKLRGTAFFLGLFCLNCGRFRFWF